MKQAAKPETEVAPAVTVAAAAAAAAAAARTAVAAPAAPAAVWVKIQENLLSSRQGSPRPWHSGAFTGRTHYLERSCTLSMCIRWVCHIN